MNSQPSDSRSYELLDERIQKWVWLQKWPSLRPAQEKAIPFILKGSVDVVISAPTSSGKTEAAFLPILTNILRDPQTSVRVLYISPLKALINDQFQRLELLCADLDLPVHKWHGDVSQTAKKKLVTSPNGLLLITPESLEAMLMKQGTHLRNIFSSLSYVVVDEVHSFIGNERGAQLQSLMGRIESLLVRRIPRIGLSATLSQPELAASFLRDGGNETVIIRDENSGELMAKLSSFVAPESEGESEEVPDSPAIKQVVDLLIKTMTGSNNLIFCNRRSDVEELTDALSERCLEQGRQDEFCAHHGNLSKEIREEAEERLKSSDRYTTCVCTSTLEMGIDIGAVKSVGQIGSPPSVSSLRQRVGRSGRRGEPSILRLISTESAINARSSIPDRLHLDLMQSLACIDLMTEGWCEPPRDTALHLSTLIQQIISVIVQKGGVQAGAIFSVLIQNGSFRKVTRPQFIELLRAMKSHDLIIQMQDGTLLLGEKGEKLANHFSFYAAFATPSEYKLMGDGKPLGTIPLKSPIVVDDHIIFAGKRWKVISVDDERRIVNLARSYGKKPPYFDSKGSGHLHKKVREKMLELYLSDEIPTYLNSTSRTLLSDARREFHENNLSCNRIIQLGRETLLFHWSGDIEANTLRLMLINEGMKVSPGLSIIVLEETRATVLECLARIAAKPAPDQVSLANKIGNKIEEKYDWVLSEELLLQECSARNIDLQGATDIVRNLCLTTNHPN